MLSALVVTAGRHDDSGQQLAYDWPPLLFSNPMEEQALISAFVNSKDPDLKERNLRLTIDTDTGIYNSLYISLYPRNLPLTFYEHNLNASFIFLKATVVSS